MTLEQLLAMLRGESPRVCYFADGDGGGGDGSGDGGSGDGDGGSGGGDKTFTQADLDRVAADTRRKFQGDVKAGNDRVAALQSAVTAGTAKQDELEAAIKKQSEMLLSADDIKRQEIETANAQAGEKLTATEAERDAAVTRWQSEKINNSLQDFTRSAKNPLHVYNMLRNSATVVPVLGSDGKATGDHAVMFKHKKTIDGKVHEIDTLDTEFYKEFGGNPDNAYLFDSKRTGGTGHGVPASGPGGVDLSKMSPAEQMAYGMAQKAKA